MNRTAILIALTVVALAGISAAIATASTVGKHTDRLTYGHIGAIVLDNTQGHIQVVAGNSHSVTIERTSQTLFASATNNAYLRKGVLHLTSRCDHTACEVDYRIDAPAGVALRITDRNATVSVAGSPGNVAISNSDTGDLTLNLAKAPRHLTAATHDGSINITVPHGAYLLTTATSGKKAVSGITLNRKATHSIHATASGDVTITGR